MRRTNAPACATEKMGTPMTIGTPTAAGIAAKGSPATDAGILKWNSLSQRHLLSNSRNPGRSGPNGTDGYFAEKDGRKFVLQDLHEMNRLAREAYPGLPVILLGHSMGSFFARMYAVLYPETLHALVLSGTGGPNPLAGVGLALTEAIGRVKGRKHRSKFLNNMAFGQYLKRVDSPDTPYDWISRDKEVVARYAQDAKCTFIFTASAFHELMAILRAVNRPQWAQKVDKRLPVALFAGDADPVGDYGRGVESVYRALKDAGVKDVFLKLYPGARHEILNETNRAEVYADILAWCDAHQA